MKVRDVILGLFASAIAFTGSRVVFGQYGATCNGPVNSPCTSYTCTTGVWPFSGTCTTNGAGFQSTCGSVAYPWVCGNTTYCNGTNAAGTPCTCGSNNQTNC